MLYIVNLPKTDSETGGNKNNNVFSNKPVTFIFRK